MKTACAVHLARRNCLKNCRRRSSMWWPAATEFESYGNFDWYTDFSTQRRRDAAEQIAAEPLIASRRRSSRRDLYLIRSGFARVSRRHGNGHRTLLISARARSSVGTNSPRRTKAAVEVPLAKFAASGRVRGRAPYSGEGCAGSNFAERRNETAGCAWGLGKTAKNPHIQNPQSEIERSRSDDA